MNPEILAIRLGSGLSPKYPLPQENADFTASVRRAQKPSDIPGTQEFHAQNKQRRLAQKKSQQGDKAAAKEYKRINREMRHTLISIRKQRIARALDDPLGFGERLVQFWADHFTVSAGSVYGQSRTAAYVEEAIRPHIGGNFADMMIAAETHPAMTTYLTQSQSVGPNSPLAKRQRQQGKARRGLNENLAREMIELHSLGVGAAYTQKDVRQLAELLTGLTYLPSDGGIFQPAMAEPGAETVLGNSYGGQAQASLKDIHSVIRDLARHEATSRHIARKMAIHFVSDDPPASLVDKLAESFRDSEGDLSAVNAVLVEAPEVEQNFRQKVRQPFDFLIAALRALGIQGKHIGKLPPPKTMPFLIRPLAAMGQEWDGQTGPDGWSESGENWVTPLGIAARIDWSVQMPQRLRKNLPDPRKFLIKSLGQTASKELQWAVPKAEGRGEGIAIVLASSDFNRR